MLFVKTKENNIDTCWSNLVLALVGEVLDPDDNVTGIVVSSRPKMDRIQIWTRIKDDVAAVDAIGHRIVETLGLEPQDMQTTVSLDFSVSAASVIRALTAGPRRGCHPWQVYASFTPSAFHIDLGVSAIQCGQFSPRVSSSWPWLLACRHTEPSVRLACHPAFTSHTAIAPSDLERAAHGPWARYDRGKCVLWPVRLCAAPFRYGG